MILRLLPWFLLSATAALADINRVLSFRYTAEQARELQLETFGGSIEVETHRGNDVVIEVHEQVDAATEAKAEELRANYSLESQQTGTRASVVAKAKGKARWFGNPVQVSIKAKVPEATQLELATSGGKIEVGDLVGALVAKTSGGPIEVGRLQGNAELRTSGGGISVKGSSANLSAHTSGGSIKVGAAAGRTELRTSGGSIRVNDATGPVDARTSGGGVEVTFTTATIPESELRTSGGGVVARVPADASCEVDLATSGGGASVDLPVLLTEGSKGESSLRGRLGQGGAKLTLRSSGGGVSVRSR